MNADRPHPVHRIFADLLATGRRLSAEARAARPADQPRGDSTRLTRVHWSLAPVGGVVVQNLAELFTGGVCAACLIPLGDRTRRRLKVRYSDALSRRCDGVLAQPNERPLGPTYHLYTKRLISLTSARQRRSLRWRAVDVVNPTKTTPQLFECVGSDIHAQVVALRGGNPDRFRCQACGRWNLPSYSSVGCLPDWLNPDGEDKRRDQPAMYLAAESLPDSSFSWYTFGDWRRGVYLAVYKRPWAGGDQRPAKGIEFWPVGIVSRDLVDASLTRAV
jgi:hypothetical protein